jgi:hypothetical protein
MEGSWLLTLCKKKGLGELPVYNVYLDKKMHFLVIFYFNKNDFFILLLYCFLTVIVRSGSIRNCGIAHSALTNLETLRNCVLRTTITKLWNCVLRT